MKNTVSHRILVIDDTQGIHDDFRKIFESPTSSPPGLDDAAAALFGHIAEPAGNGTEFIVESSYQGSEGAEKVRRAFDEGRPYSIAFVDMRMPPGWDGLETVKHLWKIDPRLQVIICTAHSDHSWHAINTVLGRTDSLIILKKPFDHIEARQLAHTLSRKWELSRENDLRLSLLDHRVQESTRERQLAEQRFSLAFDANPHAQALIALDRFEILEVNSAFSRQFGLSTAELATQTPERFGRGLDPQRWRRLLQRLAAGEEIDEYPFVFERSPGDTRDLRCSVRAVAISGRPCSIWLVRDVTEQVHVERQLRQAQKMEAVGQLAAGIAHDFNNLLTVIQSYTGIILDGASPGSEHQDSLLRVRDAADRAAALTRQLLVFSRRQIAKPAPVDLGTALQSLRSMLSRLVPERIRLDWPVPDALPWAMADTPNIEQAVMNLVINARDATPNSGVITVGFRSARLDVAAASRHPKAQVGSFVVITIADTGIGMTPEILARAPEPFFTTKEADKGTGLGLSTVYSIVEQHGGWVEVASKPGEGTTFELYLPASAAPPAAGIAPTNSKLPPSALGGKGERILFVEDEATVRCVTTMIATRAGYQVTEAADGNAALALWEKSGQQFDLVFTDVVMPNGMSGVDLAYRLRRDKPDLKIVLATGYSDELLQGAAAGLGEVPLILKPYTLTALLAILRQTLDTP